MGNKIITLERIVLSLIAILFIIYWFYLNKNLNTAVTLIEKTKLEIDSAQRTITGVAKNLSGFNIKAQQTQNQLNFLNRQRDSLSLVLTNKIYEDKWILQKYVEQLSINKAQHDSIAMLIKKFE